MIRFVVRPSVSVNKIKFLHPSVVFEVTNIQLC
jgi:hypothetical protein